MSGFEKTSSQMKRRLYGIVLTVMLLVMAYVGYTMYKVAVEDSQLYRDIANRQQFYTTTLRANRGTIYDSQGQVLAQSVTVYTVYVDPNTYKSHDRDLEDQNSEKIIADTLSSLLNVDSETVRGYLTLNTGYREVKRDVDKQTADQINRIMSENNIISVACAPTPKRYYPQGDLAANVIGHLHYDGYGIYGLESYYDDYLTGVDGKIITARDAHGAEIQYDYKQSYEAQDGDSIYTNIDTTIQYYTEKALASAIKSNSATHKGCAIVMNCNTGAILAMATEPDYDLNNPSAIYDENTAALLEEIKASGDEELYNSTRANARNLQWTNKAVSSLYFPGSVFKVVTGSAALEENAVSLQSEFYCGGSIQVADRKFHCWTKTGGHGTQNFVEAMTNSCNPAFVEIGQALGAKSFTDYFKAYGLTEKTGIDLPAEASSIYYPYDKMTAVNLAPSSFGQANKITPIQMITAFSAVVNGGDLVTPYVVNKIVDSEGNLVKEFTPTIKRQVISADTSAVMRDTLETVVTTKAGSNAYIRGYDIGGKSGTSQKLDENPEGTTYVSSYCAFFPANDSEIIMLVMIDEPTNGLYYGSAVAAPVVSEVFSEILPYMGYFAEYDEEELEELDVNVPDVTNNEIGAAKATIEALGLEYKVVGGGETVVKQVPSSGQSMPKGRTVILYTEEDYEEELVYVPDLTGYSVKDANKKLSKLGLNLKPLGGAAHNTGATCSGVMNYKDCYVPKGTVIECYFIVNNETG